MKPQCWSPCWREAALATAACLVAGAACAQDRVIVVPAAAASAPGAGYRSGSVSTVGPDVDLSNVGGATPMAPAGVAPPSAVDTLGDAGLPTPIGQPPRIGGAGPVASEAGGGSATAPSAAPTRPARTRRAPRQGTGPDGIANPGGHGVVIISPRH